MKAMKKKAIKALKLVKAKLKAKAERRQARRALRAAEAVRAAAAAQAAEDERWRIAFANADYDRMTNYEDWEDPAEWLTVTEPDEEPDYVDP